MSDAFSDYVEAAILNALVRNTTFPAPPATVYVGLHTADPGDAGALNELTIGSLGYARKSVSTTGGFDAPSGGVTQNTAEILFAAAAGGPWPTITHWSIKDAATAGNCLFKDALQTPKAVADGDAFRFPIGALQLVVA
jgi:hypothetical protein